MSTLVLQKRNYAKTIRTYTILMVVTALVAGVYGYFQFTKLSSAQQALAAEQVQITDLQKTEAQAGKDYGDLKKDFDQKYASVLDSLLAVYPAQQNYTDLARLFDNWFQANNTLANPVSANDIKFGQPRYDANSDYGVLPVSMTVTGTQDNFMKFLKFIETSGVLEDKTRLMDIRSISINFTSNSSKVSSEQPMINVSVALNAYFQKPLTKATKS